MHQQHRKAFFRRGLLNLKAYLTCFIGTADAWSQNEVEKNSNQILMFPIHQHFSDHF